MASKEKRKKEKYSTQIDRLNEWSWNTPEVQLGTDLQTASSVKKLFWK